MILPTDKQEDIEDKMDTREESEQTDKPEAEQTDTEVDSKDMDTSSQDTASDQDALRETDAALNGTDDPPGPREGGVASAWGATVSRTVDRHDTRRPRARSRPASQASPHRQPRWGCLWAAASARRGEPSARSTYQMTSRAPTPPALRFDDPRLTLYLLRYV